jgi:hypothetical protein
MRFKNIMVSINILENHLFSSFIFCKEIYISVLFSPFKGSFIILHYESI